MTPVPKRTKGCTINVSPEVYQELMVRKHERAAQLRRNVTFDDVLGELLKIDAEKKPEGRARVRKPKPVKP